MIHRWTSGRKVCAWQPFGVTCRSWLRDRSTLLRAAAGTDAFLVELGSANAWLKTRPQMTIESSSEILAMR